MCARRCQRRPIAARPRRLRVCVGNIYVNVHIRNNAPTRLRSTVAQPRPFRPPSPRPREFNDNAEIKRPRAARFSTTCAAIYARDTGCRARKAANTDNHVRHVRSFLEAFVQKFRVVVIRVTCKIVSPQQSRLIRYCREESLRLRAERNARARATTRDSVAAAKFLCVCYTPPLFDVTDERFNRH